MAIALDVATGGHVMELPRRRFLQLAAGAAALTLISTMLILSSGYGAWSQTARTIKIIVPYPPGGPADILTRVLAEQIARTQGPTLVIENRPGASGRIGNGGRITCRTGRQDPAGHSEPICHRSALTKSEL